MLNPFPSFITTDLKSIMTDKKIFEKFVKEKDIDFNSLFDHVGYIRSLSEEVILQEFFDSREEVEDDAGRQERGIPEVRTQDVHRQEDREEYKEKFR